MEDHEPSLNPRAELEHVASLAPEQRPERLTLLSQDDSMLCAFGKWYLEDSVGFSTAIARISQLKPRLPNRILDAFTRAVESASLGLGRKVGTHPVPLGSLLPHAQGDDLLVPAGYTLETTGTYRVDRRRGKELIAHYPIILEGYVRDVEQSASLVVVAWRAGTEWRRMAITRETMGVSPDLARVAGQFGAPIHSGNATSLVAYFSAFEALNLAKFEETKGMSRMGWTPELDAFLVGSRLITQSGEETIQSPSTLKEGWGKIQRVFVPSGNEVGKILSGYHRKGTLEHWQEALDIAKEHPLALTGIYLSLLPPLMQILSADNLVFEWSGRSSVGKSTALSLAASVWGQPRLNLDPSIVSSWRVTDVYVERLLATIGDLPIFLDDTRTAITSRKNGIDPVQVVYDVVAGTTKGRGTIDGTEQKRAWRTVLLSTGEDPITGNSTKGGVFARSWAINAWPFGEVSPNSAARVLRIETVIGSNYGHLGPIFVQKLMRQRKVWPKWKAIYQDLRDNYGTKGVAGDMGGITGRLGKNLAAIELCANICRSVLPEIFADVEFKNTIAELWRWAQVEGAGIDTYQEAALSLRNHVASNQSKFYFRGREEPKDKSGWWGVWPLPSPGNMAPSVFIKPDIVFGRLKADGHSNPMAVLSEWEKMGIVKPSTDRAGKKAYPRKRIKIGNSTISAIELVLPAENAEILEAYERLAENADAAVRGP